MSKRVKKINMQTVLGTGSAKQGMLFADAFTDLQQSVLAAADSTRTLASIALFLGKTRDTVLQTAHKLYLDGYVQIASSAEVLAKCDEVIAQGRLDDGIGLYNFVLQEESDNLEVMRRLAELYVRTAHAREASNLYRALAEKFVSSSRFGEALVSQRKAAGLQAGNYKAQYDLAKLCIRTGRQEEAARVWRAYAMRLAGAGEYHQALDIIDAAGREITGNDTLLYAEAEILALMESKSREQTARISHPLPLESAVVEADNDHEEPQAHSFINTAEVRGDNEKADGLVLDMSLHNPDDFDSAGTAVAAETEAGIDDIQLDYTALRYREYSTATAGNEYAKNSRGLWWGVFAVILLLIILAGVNYYYRARMYSAVLESRGIGSLIQEAGLLEKIDIGESALDVLESNRPPFEFMQSSEFNNQEARLKQLLEDAEGILLKNNLEFDALTEVWGIRHNPTLAQKILEFSKSDSIGLNRKNKAGELYNEWLKEKEQKAREQQDLIEVLADRSLKPELRFSAYQKLLVDFPGVFDREYPKGVKGLTVPSYINAEIKGTGKIVELNLVGAKKTSAGYWEIPAAANSTVIIEHRGYELVSAQGQADRTEMPYPLTFKQLFILEKAPVFTAALQLDFEPDAGIRVGAYGKFVFADRTEIAIVDGNNSLTQKIRIPRNADALSLSAAFDLFSFAEWVGVVSDGMLYTSLVSPGDSACKFAPLAGSDKGRVIYAAFYDLELGGYDGVGVAVTNYFTPESHGKVMPVELKEVGTGKRIWAGLEAVKKLSESIAAPVCSVFRLGWYFVLVGTDGEITLVMENGDIFKSFNIELKKGERITKDMVTAVRHNEKEYLCVAGRVFFFDQSEEMALVELWSLQEKSGIDLFVSPDGIVAYGGGRIAVHDVANGSMLFEYSYKGEIALRPIWLNGKLVVALKDADGAKAEVIALDLKNTENPLVWTYQLSSSPKLLFAGADCFYVYSAAGRLLGFAE